jgi:hypothetical protein
MFGKEISSKIKNRPELNNFGSDKVPVVIKISAKKQINHMKTTCKSCAKVDEHEDAAFRMTKFFLIIFFTCFAYACEDEIYSTIPSAPVHLILDLSTYDNKLNASLAHASFTKESYPEGRPRLSTDRLGFGGILAINGFGNDVLNANLYAYDLSCPVEVEPSTRVIPDDLGKARCPKCGAVYNIANGRGSPESVTKLFLRSYRVIRIDERKYQVIN